MKPVFTDIALNHELSIAVGSTTQAVDLFFLLFSHGQKLGLFSQRSVGA